MDKACQWDGWYIHPCQDLYIGIVNLGLTRADMAWQGLTRANIEVYHLTVQMVSTRKYMHSIYIWHGLTRANIEVCRLTAQMVSTRKYIHSIYMYILCTSWHIHVYTFWYWYMQCTTLVYTSTCMYILSTVNVHNDFNPITTGFCGTHIDAELFDFTEPSPDEESWLPSGVWNGSQSCAGAKCVPDVIHLICQNGVFMDSTQRYQYIQYLFKYIKRKYMSLLSSYM